MLVASGVLASVSEASGDGDGAAEGATGAGVGSAAGLSRAVLAAVAAEANGEEEELCAESEVVVKLDGAIVPGEVEGCSVLLSCKVVVDEKLVGGSVVGFQKKVLKIQPADATPSGIGLVHSGGSENEVLSHGGVHGNCAAELVTSAVVTAGAVVGTLVLVAACAVEWLGPSGGSEVEVSPRTDGIVRGGRIVVISAVVTPCVVTGALVVDTASVGSASVDMVEMGISVDLGTYEEVNVTVVTGDAGG